MATSTLIAVLAITLMCIYATDATTFRRPPVHNCLHGYWSARYGGCACNVGYRFYNGHCGLRSYGGGGGNGGSGGNGGNGGVFGNGGGGGHGGNGGIVGNGGGGGHGGNGGKFGNGGSGGNGGHAGQGHFGKGR